MVAVYAKTDLIQDLIRYVETTQSHLGGCPSAVVASRGDSVVLERYSSGVSASPSTSVIDGIPLF